MLSVEISLVPAGFYRRAVRNERFEWQAIASSETLANTGGTSHPGSPNRVFPDSFEVILKQYLNKPEVKSLTPDGTRCESDTRGLLRRTRIVAEEVIPIGKETDRQWEHGDHPSMLDFEVEQYRP